MRSTSSPSRAPWLDAVRRAVVGRGRAVRLRRATGEVVEVLVWFQPLETDGERSVLVLLQDQRETRHLETQLILAQKAEAVGRLAGAVAHDLNNLLTAIVGSTEVARFRLHEPSMLSQDLDHVVHAADRAASLTSRLLEYGRGQAESPQTIDLGEAVREAERTVRQLAGEGVATELVVPPVTMQVRMEPAEFERILVNLVVNARDAMADGGRLHIALQPRTIDRPRRPCRTACAPGRYVVLAVSDTGEGIDPEPAAARLRAVLHDQGGRARVGARACRRCSTRRVASAARRPSTSTPGVGTTVDRAVAGGRRGLGGRAGARGGVGDCRPAPRPCCWSKTRTRCARSSGACWSGRATTCSKPRAAPRALAVAATWARRIDLLLTDVIMPEMNGPQLAAQLAGAAPGPPGAVCLGLCRRCARPDGPGDAGRRADPEAVHSGRAGAACASGARRAPLVAACTRRDCEQRVC